MILSPHSRSTGYGTENCECNTSRDGERDELTLSSALQYGPVRVDLSSVIFAVGMNSGGRGVRGVSYGSRGRGGLLRGGLIVCGIGSFTGLTFFPTGLYLVMHHKRPSFQFWQISACVEAPNPRPIKSLN